MSTPDRKQPRPGNCAQPAPKKIEISIGIKIEISNTQAFLTVDTRKLADLARRVLEGEGITSGLISLAMVDNATIHRINRQHLGHDWPTDVISFTLSEPDDPELAGELVISAEMAAATAHEMRVAPTDELALYVVHGLLHLCGYDDRSQPDVRRMRDRENQILLSEGFCSALAEAPLCSALAGAPRPRPAREGQEPPSCSG
ncbi:MAG TPA: rRNA maturation RNase YbeY [Isosphaeraceae bacterium]|nr:rRNA maturation RNase YbeY [Isosphaeraceae bacterium]